MGNTMLPIILIFIALASLAFSFQVPVVSFQENGHFRDDTYLKYKGKISDESHISQLSICLRFSVFYLRGSQSTFLSYGDIDSPDALVGYIRKKKFNQSYLLVFCKHAFIKNECIDFPMENFEFFKWYHVCLTYEDVIPENNTHHETHMTIFVNGFKVNQEVIGLEKDDFLSLKSSGVLILGQEQDTLGGYFDADQSFSGELSQVQLWTEKLEDDTIQLLANCNISNNNITNMLMPSIAWNSNLDQWEEINVRKFNIDSRQFCKSRILQNYLVWATPVTYNQVFGACKRLNGKLLGMNEEVHDDVLKRFQALDQWEKCYAGENKVKFWIEKNSSSAYCSYVFGDYIESDVDCNRKYPCGICILPPAKRLQLKGICSKDAKNYYDFDFGVYGNQNDRPKFHGSQNSIMYFNDALQKWQLQSLKDPKKYILTAEKLPDNLPIGTHNWQLPEDDAICKLKKGAILELTMSQCYPNMYTCNNGDCITLSSKCDTDYDCADKSDEYYCDYLAFTENYAKQLVPRDESGKALIIEMNVSVLAFPLIDTVNLKFIADFFLNLKWYDLRINYRDLNQVTSLNALSQEDLQKIWVPKLAFKNALGPFQTKVDGLTSGVLVREGNPLPEDVTQSTESMMFSGRKNAISLTREYYQDYACEFHLHYYPFDTQVCSLIFEIQGKTDNFIRLSKASGTSGIEFLSSRKLVEYEIQMEALEFKSENNKSQAIVKFVFRRRMEFHVANTFLQTFILTCVGGFSFFFDVENFTDRIMVVLTTMLVLATVATSVQGNLPKTSYYKLIDTWLLVSLNVLVITMIFHIVLVHIIAKSKPIEGLRSAIRFNNLGKITFASLYIIFNLIFWIVAIKEYARSAQEYIN